MVSSISRNWMSGLSSGMDTQSLIDKILSAERAPINQLFAKRTTLNFQKSMLQEVNLKLFELQNKSTDLTFSKAFSSKKVSSTNENLITATASTAAKVGSYSLVVKQVATSSKAYSASGIAGNLEYGQHLKSANTVGGANLTLGGAGVALGVTPGNLTIDAGTGPQTLTLGLNNSSSVSGMVTSINAQITANAELKGKIAASYDEKNNQVKFTLLDTTKTMTIADAGGGNILQTMFGSASLTVDNLNTLKASTFGFIRSGTATTLKDLNITPGIMQISRGGGPLTNVDLTGLSTATTVQSTLETLNHRLDTAFGWSGNPAARQMEFRFDSSSRRLVVGNTRTSDNTNFTITDSTGTFSTTMFGAGVLNSTNDSGITLANETFLSKIGTGSFTIEGVQININASTDTLKSVLDRITSTTNVNATYDSAKDVLRLTRKDGSNTAIAMGSATDTSNFLSVTGLLAGNQKGAATLQTAGVIGTAAINPNMAMNGQPFTPTITLAGTQSMKVTVNGVVNNIDYLRTETLNTVLDRIKAIDGIADAFYDATTRKVTVTTDSKGSAANLNITDVGTGRLAQALRFNNTTVTGLDTGSSLESSKAISGIKSSEYLNQAGFSTPITGGSFTINGVNFTFVDPTKTTLDSLMQTITNNTQAGVKAEFDSVNGRILLTSKNTGNSSIALGAAGDTSNFLVAAGLTKGTVEVGQNAVFTVGGISGGADLIRSSNDVTDVVTGVTFKLKGVTDSSGQTIDVKADTESARKSIDDFIKSYNETMELVYKHLTDKHDYTLEPLTDEERKALSADEVTAYEAQYKMGLLSGDSTLSSVRSRMRFDIASIVSGIDSTMDQLADIGITTGVIGSSYAETQKGLLKITDTTKLENALNNNPELVSDLFAKDSTNSSQIGIARRLKNSLNEFTKSGGILTRRVGRSGTTGSNSEMDQQVNLLNDQINRQESRLKEREDSLIKQFADLETAMSRYQSQSTSFSQQLAQLTGSS